VSLPKVLSKPARDALLGQEVVATLPLETSVDVLHGADFKAALLVQAAVDGSRLDVSAGRKLEFSAAAIDGQGTSGRSTAARSR
jgi:hypothetical protein